MANQRSVRSMLASAGLALVALLGAGVAQARDVNWSLGISSPGVVVGVDNGRGVRVLPPPVYVTPPPPPPRVVYYPPPPPPPVYYAPPPRPVYYAPAPVYVTPAPAYGVRDRDVRRERHHDRYDRYDRHDRGHHHHRHPERR